jgi:cystathionine beta-lyase
VTLIAPSKTFNIAGLDCSMIICTDRELRERIKHARRGLMGGVNLLGIAAAIAAYRDGQSWLDEILHIMEGNRDFLMDYLVRNLPAIKMVKPEATYLAWLDCNGLGLPDRPDCYFLEHARVALNNGEDFGEPGRGHVRLNFGCSREVLEVALERMKSVL